MSKQGWQNIVKRKNKEKQTKTICERDPQLPRSHHMALRHKSFLFIFHWIIAKVSFIIWLWKYCKMWHGSWGWMVRIGHPHICLHMMISWNNMTSHNAKYINSIPQACIHLGPLVCKMFWIVKSFLNKNGSPNACGFFFPNSVRLLRFNWVLGSLGFIKLSQEVDGITPNNKVW